MKTSSQVRRGFLDFFAARGHTLKPSAPLIPQGDATLMFNSAGMVPFKPYFLGLKKDLSRAASCQKCFRTTDIERVGMTLRHLTFFEMLGNFSFGDYFKPEAIAWAWEFLTKDLGFDPKRLHPTVYKEDPEAEALWKKQPIVNPVTRLGDDSNFWSSGPTGPCGPCSEIYFDRGPEHSCGQPTCAVGCDCDRYLEIWNLVFMQYDRQADGGLKPLPKQNIDTGAGLERVAFALQNKPSPFDTDLFMPIVEKAAWVLDVDPKRDAAAERAFRVIADHSRAATMLMSEGVIPSNVDRGYVLRRLIRRALRYGQLLGVNKPFLHELIPATVQIFKEGYPELGAAAKQVAGTLKAEEEKFLETLERGEFELGKLLGQASRELPGEKAFWLYETFGFPLELTQEVCLQKGITVDEAGFKKASEKAADIARASWRGSGEKALSAPSGTPATKFLGYDSLESPARITVSGNVFVILDQTPFYPEGGGQVGDTGWLLSKDGKVVAEIIDTQKANGIYFHILAPNTPPPSGEVLARVDAARRARIRPHHTGTHLMNEALKRVLGGHVRQAGSYVGPDKLRFDFTHPKALTPEEIAKIEKIVNDEIAAQHPVAAKEMPVAKVQEFGATTLLGEDYGANPRFLLIGAKGWQDPKDRFSLELCGGTHCANTAEIGAFKIVRESSAAAGVRRIEALTGLALTEYMAERETERRKSIESLAAKEKALLSELGEGVPSADRSEPALKASIKNLENHLRNKKAGQLAAQAEAGSKTLEVKGLKLAAQRLDGADPKSLRGLSDKLKSELGSGLVFLATAAGGKLSFVLAATPDLAAKGVDAGKIAKAFAGANGGSAGGRADFAQGGVADADWDKVVSGLTAAI
jgi:alanyl-tRNA synthetase